MFILFGAITVAAFLHCENEFLFFFGCSDKIEYRLATRALNYMIPVRSPVTLRTQITKFFVLQAGLKNEEASTFYIVTLGKMSSNRTFFCDSSSIFFGNST